MAKLDIAPELELKVLVQPVSGDLRVRGWERDTVQVDGDLVTLQHEEGSGQVTVACQGDARLSLPHRAALSLGSTAGDARITDLEGEIELANVSGDLVLRDVGPTRLENVSADLRVRRVNGAFEAANVGADATVRDVEGDVYLQNVGADLFVGDVEGNCVVERVGSDLVLSIPFYPENTYAFNAGADVVCRVLPESSVRFLLPLEANVEIKAEGAVESQDETFKVVTFGDGEATVRIEAGGKIRLVHKGTLPDVPGRTFEFDFDFDVPFELDERLAESFSSIEETLADKLADLDQRLSITIARQTEKAQKHAEKLRRQAEKRAARLQKAAERRVQKGKRHVWSRAGLFGGPKPPEPPAPPSPPPSEPVSDEERLTILRMVERGQISAEEAERLLAALEGRSK